MSQTYFYHIAYTETPPWSIKCCGKPILVIVCIILCVQGLVKKWMLLVRVGHCRTWECGERVWSITVCDHINIWGRGSGQVELCGKPYSGHPPPRKHCFLLVFTSLWLV